MSAGDTTDKIRTISCDVVVVGAGPGGSMAAKFAAMGGLDVIVLEKKAEIGSPLRCAEGVSKKWFDSVGIEFDESWISSRIQRMKFVSPSGFTFVSDESGNDGSGRGYVLERHLFDKALARQAVEAGAKIMMRTSCRDVIRKDGRLVGIKADEMGELVEIYAKCVVAADGFESQVARWAGLDTSLEMKDIDTCIQYRMTNVDVDSNTCEFRIGSASPGGYVWIFPKGEGIANVGIGLQATRCQNGIGPKYYLDKFISEDPRLKDGQVMEIVGGGVSTSKPVSATADNLIAVGDAARFINPLTGGGIHEACISGMYAGNTLVKCASIGSFSKKDLVGYEEMWEKEVGRRFTRNVKIKEMFVEMSDELMDQLIILLDDAGMKKMKMDSILRILAEKNPSVLKTMGINAEAYSSLDVFSKQKR